MLILMRRVGETICIGDDVFVKVVSLERNRVRVGITAPPHIRVDREEVAKKKQLGIRQEPKAIGATSV